MYSTAVQRITESTGEPVETGLGGSVDVIGASHPHPRNRGEHHQVPTPLFPEELRGVSEYRDLRQEIRGDDVESVLSIVLGAGLVSEYAERENHDPDGAVLLGDLTQKFGMGIHRVCVELDGSHGFCTGLLHPSYLRRQICTAPSRQYDGSPWGESGGDFQPDLAAAAQQQQRSDCGFCSSAHADQSGRSGTVHYSRVMAATPADATALTDDALGFLTERHLATLTTLRPDGTPHVVAVGFTYDAEALVVRVITNDVSQKAINARRGGYAAVTQVDGARWLTLEGPASVREDRESVVDAENRYAQRYRVPRENPTRVVIEVRVQRVLGSRSLLSRQ